MAIGSTLRPELGRMDFSGIERGGRAAAEAIMRGSERLGSGIQSAGASIGGAIKERGEMKSVISSADKMAEGLKSVQGINPEVIQILDSMKIGFKDEELPLSQRANAAKQFLGAASQVINLGVMRAMEKPKPPSQTEQYLNAVKAINLGGFPAVPEGKPSIYNRNEAVQTYLDSGGTDMKAFDAAEAQMIKQGEIPTPEFELKTKQIEGTNYVAVQQPSGSWSVIPSTPTGDDQKQKTKEELYNESLDAINKAKDSGILKDEEAESAIANLKSEIYGVNIQENIFADPIRGLLQNRNQSDVENTNPLGLPILENGR